MKKTRYRSMKYTEDQRALALNQAEKGAPTQKIIRKDGCFGADLLQPDEVWRLGFIGVAKVGAA